MANIVHKAAHNGNTKSERTSKMYVSNLISRTVYTVYVYLDNIDSCKNEV